MEAGFIPRPDLLLESGSCGIDVAHDFQFVDITASGTIISDWQGTADNGYFTVSLAGYFGGTPMQWYGNTYESISISTNGYLVFGEMSYTGSVTQPLPNPDPVVDRVLAGF